VAGFEQVSIPVQKPQEFGELRGAIARVFSPEWVEKFFSVLKRKDLRIRDLESVLAKRVLEQFEPGLGEKGNSAWARYDSLPLSDKGQIREFYLMRLEQVSGPLRHKFSSVYRDN
jgi:hypothetical protein